MTQMRSAATNKSPVDSACLRIDDR